MDTQQGFEEANVSTKKTPKSHKNWRKVEEDALIKVMMAEFSDKWSTGNGFKPGFFSLVEKQLEKDWAILFGKDRATRARAEYPTQMEQVYTPNPLQDSVVNDVEDFYVPLFDDQFMNSPHVSVSSTPTVSRSPHNNSGRARKARPYLDTTIQVGSIIGDKEERVDQFLNTSDERKQAWAEAVLNGHVYGPIP
ncbi:hypothetical protein Acr_12g0004450 [Actinidia rufa]|uniref:Myb/SANT-like domain-containing protein n=1 Tax=Actinidia rufa TaxID=165716 RepID=A0A7J0FGS3_9ERIC|nr:hypothetical protein Acr_12g0004450 [Actinidia rufa]